jgi:hypothetical protein
VARPKWRDERTPPEVVAEAGQPSRALMEFVTRSLEAAGFSVITTDWPVIAVDVGGHRYTVRSGGSDPQSRRLRRLLAELQCAVDDL